MLKQGSLYFENTYIPSTNFVDRIQRKLHTATVFQNLIMGLGIYDFENTRYYFILINIVYYYVQC